MSRAAHPARSLDFLSRLHDGELSAAEKAHFESHRAHCDECRKAAADFEATLAYYRTAGTSPAASDLSARILRRLEAANRRRPGFGVVFGIDLRWAGAFTAALLAVILGASLVERQRDARSIPVSFATPPPNALTGALAKKNALAAQTLERQAAAASAKDRAAATPNALATSLQAPAAAPAPPADKTQRIAAAAEVVAAPPSPAPKIATKAPRARDAGGEGAASEEKRRRAPAEATFDAVGESVVLTTPARLTVTALDDGGLAPAVLNGAKIELSESDRGRYVVTVGADGVPLDVVRESLPGTARMIAAAPTPTDRTLRVLKELRFAPGRRARRLLALVQ
ncbi:MAG TPA: zf-HC2 domain-containing protein [Thermoanaerobaculia bacterium]|nr:zf-HC2 domain-containing protein [Thermoanaerobaculia bacterium]